MLTITARAASVIDDLADASPLPVAGLRLTHREDSRALEMDLVEEPQQDDEVIAFPRSSTLVFLDPTVLGRLSGSVLDVKTEPGASAFFLREP